MDGTEGTEDNGRRGTEKEMSTEIRFEISAGKYDAETEERTVTSRSAGLIRTFATEAARTALIVGLEIMLAKRTGKER